MLQDPESWQCESPSDAKPVFYSFGKLHCRVLNLKNTCSPLFRGKRKPCHFNMGFKLDPLWNSPGKCGEE